MPRTLIVLSDGTGNSSAKLFRTNVWRLYESLDLSRGDQIALYDNGVGTSSFLPLAILGGAFGFGLKRNVLGLYAFLCEHYEPGDRIFAFGFSRGAFTIRVLVALIDHQGIISKDAAPGDLPRLAAWAYRAYRRSYRQSGAQVEVLRSARDVLYRLRDRLLRKAPYDSVRRHALDAGALTFVGVWDAVDAYGVPIDELAHGIDRWVWPLKLPTRGLSSIVGRACHALALDDERQSFHPVLWDEQGEPQNAAHLHGERVSQVWFAGMHSNVGGGYPDDALSLISFKWMVDEAKRFGLRFLEPQLARWLSTATSLGRTYDSRQGLSAYYRFGPRRVRRLTDGGRRSAPWLFWPRRRRKTTPTWPSVRIRRPKIHHSVFDRIRQLPGYAPIVLPTRYAVVTQSGAIVEGSGLPFEPTVRTRVARALAQEAVWDLVWWRRLLYFATIAATLALALRPAGVGPDPDRLPNVGIFLSGIVTALGSFAPGILAPAVRYFSTYPLELIIGVVVIGGLMLASTAVQARIGHSMRAVWSASGAAREAYSPPPALLRAVARGLRTSPAAIWTAAVFSRFVWPTLFGLGVWLLILGLLNRGVFELRSSAGAYCAGGQPTPVALQTPKTVSMTSGGFCQSTGILMERGAQYRVEVSLPTGEDTWKDWNIPVTGPEGLALGSPQLTLTQRAIFALSFPFRRVWRPDWFVPVARIGSGGADHYALAAPATMFSARKDGELFLFVNDAVIPVGAGPQGLSVGFDAYYRNNLGGQATVTVRKLAEPGAPRAPCGPDVRCEDSLM